MLLLAGMQKGHFILVPTLQRNSNLKETFTKMVHIIFKAGFFFFFFLSLIVYLTLWKCCWTCFSRIHSHFRMI